MRRSPSSERARRHRAWTMPGAGCHTAHAHALNTSGARRSEQLAGRRDRRARPMAAVLSRLQLRWLRHAPSRGAGGASPPVQALVHHFGQRQRSPYVNTACSRCPALAHRANGAARLQRPSARRSRWVNFNEQTWVNFHERQGTGVMAAERLPLKPAQLAAAGQVPLLYLDANVLVPTYLRAVFHRGGNPATCRARSRRCRGMVWSTFARRGATYVPSSRLLISVSWPRPNGRGRDGTVSAVAAPTHNLTLNA
jgi:hypothetical protein